MPDGLSDGESAVYMKLLFVHQHLGAWGGAEANIQTTARELVRRGHTVALAHAEMTGRGVETAREAFSECFQLPSADTKAAVAAFVRRFEPDLIYLHHLQDLDVFEQLLETGIPVVRMVHDHSLYCLRSYKYNPLTRKICTRAASVACVFPCLGTIQRNRGGALPVKWASYSRMRKEMRLTGQCRRLVAYSEHSRNELVRNGFAANKILLHVPLEMPAEETITPSFSERNLIVFAGQVIRGKGVDLLLKALSKVSVPFECHILGDGSHRAACERLADKLGLGSRVRFEGFI
ncbi:MAG TPA: glycosyltransferase, partial [Candidatus Dormibacteraeota bacterium]|nr:glycosyltransferase [Candidatus Dormibacteraeota bacterium]